MILSLFSHTFFSTLPCLTIFSFLVLGLFSCTKEGNTNQNSHINTGIQDSLLASEYYQLSFDMSNSAPDSAMYYAWKSYHISNKSNNGQQTARALSQIGFTHTVQSQTDSAILYFQKAAISLK